MKHLKIKNKGIVDLALMRLIGASTKKEDVNKIGQFGTGLKYALSYLLRNGNNFKVFVGEEEVRFEAKEVKIVNKTIQEIYFNDQSMNITTEYGYQWTAWEIIRELWCNAIDEEDASKDIIDGRSTINGEEGFTTFYIELTQDIQEVVDSWDKYFITRDALYSDDKIAIFKNNDEKDELKIYKNHVLVDDNKHFVSLFHYDLKSCDLNELRQYRGYLGHDVGSAIMNSNKEVVKLYLEDYNFGNENFYETRSSYFGMFDYSMDKIRDIFEGYVFLHPESSKQPKGKIVSVPNDLYEILEKCGMPCEKINTKNCYNGYYGGGGSGYGLGSLSYKEVQNSFLNNSLKRLARKYKYTSEIVIALPITAKEDFEVIPDGGRLVFNSNLDVKSDKDLEAIFIIGMLHNQESNMYSLMKRFIKIILRSSNFKKVLFGS